LVNEATNISCSDCLEGLTEERQMIL